MHLERVVMVNKIRFRPDEGMGGFDVRHMEEPLKCSGLVDNIDSFYFGDYTNSDEALINYCLQKKPQVVLLCLSGLTRREKGGPTPNAVWKITHQLRIPTVVFWFDIHSDFYAELLESYLHSVTLNVIGGADASSHKTLPLEGTNYVYAGLTFDERLFSKPDSVRDIPVGFLGRLNPNRLQWIEGLQKCGISAYIGGGHKTAGWMSYEEYLGLMSRLRIALNFSLIGVREYNPMLLSDRGRVWEAMHWLAPQLKTWFSALVRNPLKAKYIIPVFKNTAPVLLKKPRYMVRARLWEALWCRTFLLEEDNPVTSLYFEPYVDYVPFTTAKDLVDKIRYYLENEEERDRIRMCGHATVEKYYNAQIYWENLFQRIGIQSGPPYHHHPGQFWNKAYFRQLLSEKSSIDSYLNADQLEGNRKEK